MVKRIFLFLALNFAIVLTISLVLQLLGVKPYLTRYGLDMGSLAIFCLVWGMGGAVISLFLSKYIAKWSMGVKVVSPETSNPQHLFLLQMVEKLAEKGGIPMPEVGIFPSREINAFATGWSKSHSLVAVSSGLLEKMQDEEISAVLGHEISHIANGDMVTMTLLQGMVNAFVLFLARILAFALSGMGKRGGERSSEGGGYGSYIVLTYLFEVVFLLFGSMIVAAYSRYREFRADLGGAKLAGKDRMLSALKTLQVMQEVKDPQEHPALAAFKISNPPKKKFFSLFATHPPLKIRIERLQKSKV